MSKSLVALRIRSLTNCGEHAAEDWGSRGRRFKSCHPDWDKQQVRGRFREIGSGFCRVWRPKCSNGCSNGIQSHQPIAAESRSKAGRAPAVETWPYTSPVTATDEDPRSSETVCSGTPASSMCVANECLSVCRPTPVMPEALAAVLIAHSAFLGSTAAPLSVVKTWPVSTHIEAAVSRSTAWFTLTDGNSVTVVGERGTPRRDRSVLGSLMTQMPSDPRERATDPQNAFLCAAPWPSWRSARAAARPCRRVVRVAMV